MGRWAVKIHIFPRNLAHRTVTCPKKQLWMKNLSPQLQNQNKFTLTWWNIFFKLVWLYSSALRACWPPPEKNSSNYKFPIKFTIWSIIYLLCTIVYTKKVKTWCNWIFYFMNGNGPVFKASTISFQPDWPSDAWWN